MLVDQRGGHLLFSIPPLMLEALSRGVEELGSASCKSSARILFIHKTEQHFPVSEVSCGVISRTIWEALMF